VRTRDYHERDIIVNGLVSLRWYHLVDSATSLCYCCAILVRLKVKDVAERKGITNPLMLSKESGVPYAACHAIWNDQQKQIGLATINKLCVALKVKPGQLFEYEPD